MKKELELVRLLAKRDRLLFIAQNETSGGRYTAIMKYLEKTNKENKTKRHPTKALSLDT